MAAACSWPLLLFAAAVAAVLAASGVAGVAVSGVAGVGVAVSEAAAHAGELAAFAKSHGKRRCEPVYPFRANQRHRKLDPITKEVAN